MSLLVSPAPAVRSVPATIPPGPFSREVIVIGLGFAVTLFVISSVIWGLAGIDPVQSALPKVIGISADAILAVLISLVLWRMSGRGLGLKALVACLLSLLGAIISASIDRGLQVYMTLPDPAPFSTQYFASVITFTAAELFGWSCLYLALQYSAQIRETERRLALARQQAMTAQMRALHYQVNPHFLFNTLNAVAGLIEEGDSASAGDMVLRLAGFLRKTLALDPLSDMSLHDEIALQRDYLAIEEARFPDRLTVHVHIQPGIDAARVPALILQPLVENAIKHGVARIPDRADLEIGAERRPDGLLRIWVENPVPVLQAEAGAPDGMGIGLKNVAERLAARHPGKAFLDARIVSPGRLRAEIVLPVQR